MTAAHSTGSQQQYLPTMQFVQTTGFTGLPPISAVQINGFSSKLDCYAGLTHLSHVTTDSEHNHFQPNSPHYVFQSFFCVMQMKPIAMLRKTGIESHPGPSTLLNGGNSHLLNGGNSASADEVSNAGKTSTPAENVSKTSTPAVEVSNEGNSNLDADTSIPADEVSNVGNFTTPAEDVSTTSTRADAKDDSPHSDSPYFPEGWAPLVKLEAAFSTCPTLEQYRQHHATEWAVHANLIKDIILGTQRPIKVAETNKFRRLLLEGDEDTMQCLLSTCLMSEYKQFITSFIADPYSPIQAST